MRMLILGATGGTGRALIDQASQRGHAICAAADGDRRRAAGEAASNLLLRAAVLALVTSGPKRPVRSTLVNVVTSR